MPPGEPTADLEREERQLHARWEANVAAAKEALETATRCPTVEGSVKQVKAHPCFEVAAACDQLAVRYHAELEALRKRRAEIAEIDAGKVSDARLR